MKQLLIMRHAKSDWGSPGKRDHDRPLNKRGSRVAPDMGDWLIRQEIEPELVISSTATRARLTTELVLSRFEQEIQVQFDSNLYHASPETWRTIIPVYTDSEETILIVGHNPGLEQLVLDLTGVYEAMPTATIAQIALECEAWSEISNKLDAKLINLWRPKEIGID